MSNLEDHPAEGRCGPSASPLPELLEPRDVPLGGPRAMTVRRTLPHKRIRTIGGWCFLDHFGPDDHRMVVPPHPHTGLQTVSWLLSGQIEHRDSVGSLQTVRPGELNVMTAGHGIAHSEYAVGDAPWHGVQLWVALTAQHRDRAPVFEHHRDLPDDGQVRVLMGELAGLSSPATTFSPLVGAQITGSLTLPIEPDFEYAVLALDGPAHVNGYRVPHGALQYLGWGADSLSVAGSRMLLLGGEPLAEDLLMWWNFVGRSHEEIVTAREQWQAGDARFGAVAGDDNPRLPAPPMPTVRLKPRASR